MGGVPPVHFEVELAFPTIVSQPGFLWRQAPGALDGRKVLRQNDAPLQLVPARIFDCRQIYRAAGGPKPLPMLARAGAGLIKAWEFGGRRCW